MSDEFTRHILFWVASGALGVVFGWAAFGRRGGGSSRRVLSELAVRQKEANDLRARNEQLEDELAHARAALAARDVADAAVATGSSAALLDPASPDEAASHDAADDAGDDATLLDPDEVIPPPAGHDDDAADDDAAPQGVQPALDLDGAEAADPAHADDDPPWAAATGGSAAPDDESDAEPSAVPEPAADPHDAPGSAADDDAPPSARLVELLRSRAEETEVPDPWADADPPEGGEAGPHPDER